MNTITDENIREIFKSHKVNLSTPDINQAIYDAARDLIALAQEVRPLEFVQTAATQKGVVTNYGIYKIIQLINVVAAKFPNDTYFDRHFSSEAEAMRAAQADFNRRVLANLVHGDAE
jgi:hypothetical protein